MTSDTIPADVLETNAAVLSYKARSFARWLRAGNAGDVRPSASDYVELADMIDALLADRSTRPDRIREEAAEDERDRLFAKAKEQVERRLLSGLVIAVTPDRWLSENGAMLPNDRVALRATQPEAPQVEDETALVERLAKELDRSPEMIRRSLANLVAKGLIVPGAAHPEAPQDTRETVEDGR